VCANVRTPDCSGPPGALSLWEGPACAGVHAISSGRSTGRDLFSGPSRSRSADSVRQEPKPWKREGDIGVKRLKVNLTGCNLLKGRSLTRPSSGRRPASRSRGEPSAGRHGARRLPQPRPCDFTSHLAAHARSGMRLCGAGAPAITRTREARKVGRHVSPSCLSDEAGSHEAR